MCLHLAHWDAQGGSAEYAGNINRMKGKSMLSGKNAIVTGANRGIGRAIVETFARNGANVWACARKSSNDFEKDISQLGNQYHVWIKPVYFELEDEAEIKEGIKGIISEHEKIDILINNAGIFDVRVFQMSSMEMIRKMYQINVFAPMLITQMVLKAMARKKEGCVINIGSLAGEQASPGNSVYGSSKAALMHWTKILASEAGAAGIRVNAVAPGSTETDILAAHGDAAKKELWKESFMNRLGRPEEVAEAVAFLASDKAQYINGCILDVNGGVR